MKTKKASAVTPAGNKLQDTSYQGTPTTSIQNLQELIGLLLFDLQIRKERNEARANWAMFAVLLEQYIKLQYSGDSK
jgi:hypothetical protein